MFQYPYCNCFQVSDKDSMTKFLTIYGNFYLLLSPHLLSISFKDFAVHLAEFKEDKELKVQVDHPAKS